jgi:hypothetical protein
VPTKDPEVDVDEGLAGVKPRKLAAALAVD